GLRQIAPTVLVSALPAATTLQALREAGYAPALEDSAGVIEIDAPRRLRARPARTFTDIGARRLRSHITTLDLAHQLLNDS
ncbi:MAG: hypothetical protein JWN00_6218, partial [Actinomycetia bacterium]|nr:hypothetical protein [Actinomycetes bacterium]